jgi:hypothetical protein
MIEIENLDDKGLVTGNLSDAQSVLNHLENRIREQLAFGISLPWYTTEGNTNKFIDEDDAPKPDKYKPPYIRYILTAVLCILIWIRVDWSVGLFAILVGMRIELEEYLKHRKKLSP